MKFRYKLSSTDCNSNSIGRCMICGKHCNEVYHQIEDREYTRPNGDKGYTQQGCTNLFGHEDCLKSKRR